MTEKRGNILLKEKQWLPLLLLAVSIFVVSSYMVYWGFQKEGFFIDEMFSMMDIRGGGLGRPYDDRGLYDKWHTASELESTIGVTAENAFTGIFNARNLYWSLLHIAYSFTPDEFSAWPSIILNIIFLAGSLIVIYLLSLMFIDNKYLALLPGLLWGFSSAAVNLVLYIRFYCFKTFICLLLAYVVLVAVNKKFNKWVYPAAIAGVMAAGVFVHQYFLVFAFFLSAIVCFYLLYKKEYKPLLIFAGIMAAGAAAYEIFTETGITGLFSAEDGRAAEAIESIIQGNEGYIDRIILYFDVIKRAVFADVSLYAVFAVIAICIIIILFYHTRTDTQHKAINESYKGYDESFKYKQKFISFLKEQRIHYQMILGGVCIFYLLTIARIAPYQDFRYISCITPFITILVTSLIVKVLRITGFKRIATVFIIIALPCSFMLLRNIDDVYIKREKGYKETLAPYYRLPVVCVDRGESLSRLYWLFFDFEDKILITPADDKYVETINELSYHEGFVFITRTGDIDANMEFISDAAGLNKSTHIITLVRHSVFFME